MSYLSLVIYINEEDYSTLLSEGEIEKNGETYYYDESALYVIKDVSVPEYAETAGYASQAGSARVAERATTDASGNNIVQTYGKKPLVIEVDDTDFDTILKSGTYNSVTLAINNGRDVIIKATMTNEGDQILYFNLSIDYSEDHSTYNFYSTYLGYGLVLDDTNLLEFFSNASPNGHYHGNINPLGRISSTTTIANGDKLVITDASANNSIIASSISFDGSTTTQALSKKGTWETFYLKPSGGIPATDLTSAVQALLTAAGTALLPADITTLTNKVTALEDLVATDSDAVIDKFNEIVAFLNGISATDTLLGLLADIATLISAKYTKPSGGIPKTDLASAVLTSLGLADTALQSIVAGENVTVSGNQVSVPTFPVDKVVPIYEKTYENYTCGTANTNDMYIFFGNVIPTSNNWYEPWEIYYTLKVSTSNDLCLGLYDIKVSFTGTTVVYSIYNRFYSSSYYPIYTHYWLYHSTLEKYNSREDHPFKIGARVLSAYLQTSLARTYEIKVWELKGCTFNFPQNIETYTNIWNTNYWAGTTANATSLGLLETGDTDTTTAMLLYYSKVKAGINGIKRYSLIMLDRSGAWSSFTTGIGGIDPKNKNTVGFILGSPIYYVLLSGDTAPNEYIGYGAIRTKSALIDLRYSLNINTTANGLPGNLLPRLPLYIVGHLESDGLFYLEDTWWSQTEPTTEDGKIYIKVAESVYADYENARCYRADLVSDGYAYWFKDGQFLRYSLQSYSQNSVNEFIYRKTLNPTKGDYGQITKIEGNTVTMHQMLGTGTADIGSWTLDGTTYTGTNTANNTIRLLRYSVPTIKDHKYYFSAKYKLIRDTTISGSFYCGYFGGPTLWLGSKISGETIRAGYNHKIVITSASNHSNVQVGLYGGSSDIIAAADTLTVSDIMLIDLTRIYGAGYEPTYSEQFESDYFKRFGKPLTYEAFNSGYLRNVKMSSIKTVGFNLLKLNGRIEYSGTSLSPTANFNGLEENMIIKGFAPNGYWNSNTISSYSIEEQRITVHSGTPINSAAYGLGFVFKAFPTMSYYFSTKYSGTISKYIGITWIGLDGKLISYRLSGADLEIISPTNAKYGILTFIPNSVDVEGIYIQPSINISNTNKNGTYEPYWSDLANIPVTEITGIPEGGTEADRVTIFSDGMLSANSVHDEIYKQGGKTYAIKRVGRVDLGSLTWAYSNVSNSSRDIYTVTSISNIKYPSSPSIVSNIICSNFTTVSQEKTWVPGDLSTTQNGLYCIVKPSQYVDASAFKTAMSGVYLNYELATPIIYTDLQYADGTPFNLPISYKAEKGGTEEIIPVTGEESVAPILNITYGGTSSQFLKADGSVDSNAYLTSQDISGKADKSNITAGTYKSVTVNNQGIVTAGTNPTTLSGYGITDAVTLTGQQTISGLKTFSSGVKLLTASAWDNADRGIPFSDPSDTTKIVYTYTDSNKGLTYNPNTGALKVGSIVKRNGISSQFLKADGSVDVNEYINTSSTAQSKAGNLTATKFITSGGTSSLVLLGNGTLQAKDSIDLYEAYLKWGGKDFSASYGPIDAAMVGLLGANRFAFGKVAGISIEYSRDGGNTWVDYEAPDSVKGNLFANNSSYIKIGKASSESPATPDYLTRVTITLGPFGLYTVLNKFVIHVSTSGSTYNWCTIMGRLRSNYDNNVDSWSTFKSKVPIAGWSGYNIINYPNGITFGGNSSQVYLLRFIFGCDGAANSLSSGMTISNISAFGGVGWGAPSWMATNGHLYSYDYLQNATFPANITATAIKKSGGTSSLFLKADGSVDSSVYAPLASPALTGTPTAPTASLNTNTTLIATTAFVTNAVLTIMNASPATLLVLNDLATALGNDPNLATTLLALIAAKYTKPSGGIPQSDLAEPLVHLTLEEYDELSSAEKNNGTWYFIEEE